MLSSIQFNSLNFGLLLDPLMSRELHVTKSVELTLNPTFILNMMCKMNWSTEKQVEEKMTSNKTRHLTRDSLRLVPYKNCHNAEGTHP